VHCKEQYGGRIKTIEQRHWKLVEWMPFHWVKDLSRMIGSNWPSSGLCIAYWLFRRGLLEDTSIYNMDQYETGYYWDDDPLTPVEDWRGKHDMVEERKYMDILKSYSRRG
jgi:hypothetical protein